MKIALIDGLRHTNLSGYGALARNIIFGLDELGHTLFLQARNGREWGEIEAGARERLESFPTLEDLEQVDLALQVGTPAAAKWYPKPSLIYTQNALGDLTPAWVASLLRADGCIVPSRFDRGVFSRYIERVSVASQSSDPSVFRSQPEQRSQGRGRFAFIFVGSYSYRKGVDLLLEAFLREFDPDEEVELIIQAPGLSLERGFDQVLPRLQRLNPLARVRARGSLLSPEEMCRLYNRADCLVTLSRGEGWCMPVTEALLCELPVIAPCSTAMGEYLSDEIAYLVPVSEREIAEIPDGFAKSFVEAYGQPGNVCYEPQIEAARRQMRTVFNEPEAARTKARIGAELIRERLTWESSARSIERACLDLLA